MNQLLQSLTHLTIVQFIIVFGSGFVALLKGIKALRARRSSEGVNMSMFYDFLLPAAICIITMSWYVIEMNRAIENHQYTAKIDDKLLIIDSHSDNIKSDKLEIINEDSNSIQVKKVTRYGQTNYTIEKSELDK